MQIIGKPRKVELEDAPFENLGFEFNHERYFEEPRKFRVICIGSGFSGVYVGIRLPMACPDVELVIYEKNQRVGGTWEENVYPGAQCDIPSHRYAYTFELNADWKHFYSYSPEIREYIDNTARKYGAMDYIKFGHKLTSAIWDEESGMWNLELEHQGQTIKDSCNMLINACGPLNNWMWPDIPGREQYKGQVLHSAAWDNAADFKGKDVAVLGSGSSSIQIVPTLQPTVRKMTAHIRSPMWINPGFSEDLLPRLPNGSPDIRYSKEQIDRFRTPSELIAHREALEGGISQGFQVFLKDTKVQKINREVVAGLMRKRLAKKPELADILIPKFELGCRRLTPGIGYLEALVEDNVQVVTTPIKAFTETGLEMEDGEKRDYDAVICATGFNVSHVPRFKLVGRNGYQLDQKFAKSPYGYFAMAINSMPNYFTINGPNAPIGQGSLVPASEQQVEYICKAIDKMRRQDIKTICIKDKAVEEFTRYGDSWMTSAVWTGSCRSWYKGNTVNGRVTALWPGSGLHFIEALENPRWEDFDYTYLDPICRYSYFNSGLTKVEVEGGNRNIPTLKRMGIMKDHPRLNDEQKAEKRAHWEAAHAAIERAKLQPVVKPGNEDEYRSL